MLLPAARLALLSTLSMACGDERAASADASPTQANDAGDDASAVAPLPPFSVSLAHGSCGGGDCPNFSLRVDQTGHVAYFGTHCTVRPGVFTRRIPVADAVAVERALASRNYASLRNSYLTEADGCTQVVPGSRVAHWKVEADGGAKTVSYSHGCQSAPELAPMIALEPEVQRLTLVGDFVGDAGSACGPAASNGLVLAARYRLSLGERVIGLLGISASQRRWTLTTCAHDLVAIGSAAVDPRRWALVADGPQPIELPEQAGSVGSIVLERVEGTTLRARGLRSDDEVVLTVSATDTNACL
jgi:hypothetical protein